MGRPRCVTAPPPADNKEADESWKDLENLQQPPEQKPLSREEGIAQLKKWLEAQKGAAEAFAQKFPSDPRSWQARMIGIRAGMQLRRFTGENGDPAADKKKLDEIISAPDAPATVIRAEAAFNSAAIRPHATWELAKPETFTAFYDAVNAADFLEKYPDHPLAGEVKSMEMQVLNQDPTPAGGGAPEETCRRRRCAAGRSGEIDSGEQTETGRPEDEAGGPEVHGGGRASD